MHSPLRVASALGARAGKKPKLGASNKVERSEVRL